MGSGISSGRTRSVSLNINLASGPLLSICTCARPSASSSFSPDPLGEIVSSSSPSAAPNIGAAHNADGSPNLCATCEGKINNLGTSPSKRFSNAKDSFVKKVFGDLGEDYEVSFFLEKDVHGL